MTPSTKQEAERQDFEAAMGAAFDFTRTKDAWDRSIYKHEHIESMFFGWITRDRQARADQSIMQHALEVMLRAQAGCIDMNGSIAELRQAIVNEPSANQGCAKSEPNPPTASDTPSGAVWTGTHTYPSAQQAGDALDASRLALNVRHPNCHKAADAFWTYWNENGETHKRGYYESTWGAINRAIRMVGVVEHDYGSEAITGTLESRAAMAASAKEGGE